MEGFPTRLYSTGELESIFKQRGMKIISTFSDYEGNPASNKNIQLMVYSIKN